MAFIILFLSIGLAYGVVDPHTVAAWTFDELEGDVVRDVSGNGHDGVLKDGAKWSREGKFGGAIEFDGVEACVEVPHDDDLNLEAFSIEAWVKCTPGANQAILHKQGPGNASERNYILNIRPEGFLRGSFSSGGVQHNFDGKILLKAGKWYHVAATYDGKVGRIYVNGELDAETELNLKLEPNDAPLLIGKAGGTGGARFKGLMDEVRLSNVARSREEIKKLMEKGLKAALLVSAKGKLALVWGSIKGLP
jgi:hypothetical protein